MICHTPGEELENNPVGRMVRLKVKMENAREKITHRSIRMSENIGRGSRVRSDQGAKERTSL